jgi:arylsulfatase A-like enzyme
MPMALPIATGTADFEEASPPPHDPVPPALSPISFLLISAWCGLIAGLSEVGITVLRKQWVDVNHLYWMDRHFVWVVPLANVAIFLVLGALLALAARCGGPRSRWLAPRLLGALCLTPALWAAFPRIYGLAAFLLALGAAARFVPAFARRGTAFRRLVCASFPVGAGIVAIIGGSLWLSDRRKAWREDAQALPPPGAPSVLLIVLDTVAASHLDLCGYPRPTGPTLVELAGRSVRFDRAQAASSWTLPSHASMFTGRWPHEISAGWLNPMDGTFPTLAEFLGRRGYATAAFTANYAYCASDSGLERGFTEFRDHVFPRLSAFGSAVLVDRPLAGLQTIERFLEDQLDLHLCRQAADYLRWLFKSNRKEAAVVNREFLAWLAGRPQPERPYFAFLNYFDAHYPYELPTSGIHRFRPKPRNDLEANLIRDWPVEFQRGPSPSQIAFVRDAYDDCVAALDEQIGCLFDELERRAALERTWVIITADHGESFGEQPGVFWHGTSLYQPQLHVPLLIIPPGAGPAPGVVTETVSLRDLPATVADLVGLKQSSPFPGESLARFWNKAAAPGHGRSDPDPALSEVVPLDIFNADPSRWVNQPRWPLAALTETDWKYIRREGDVREELFHLPGDAGELQDLAGERTSHPALKRLRENLIRLTDGPLLPPRFRP